MKISLSLLAITLLVLMSVSSISITPNIRAVSAYTGPSIRLHEIAKPPLIKLDSSFNPATVYNPAVTPVGGAPFCSSSGLGTILCYPPAFLKKAYDFPTTLTGAGQTIVIVDAFGSPTIQSDLNKYDTAFGIPATTITRLCPPTFSGAATDVCPDTTADFSDSPPLGSISDICGARGWGEETTLDVTQAHALATGAKIILVEAASCFDQDLNAASMAVVTQPSLRGSIMSQSFGEPDDLVGCNYFPCNMTTPGVFDPTIRSTYDSIASIATSNMWTLLASTGDDGANEAYPYGLGELTPGFPSTNPYVLAVGGAQGLPYGGQYGPPPGPGVSFACTAGATCNTGVVVISGGSNGCQASTRPGVPTGCSPTRYGGEGAWQEWDIFGSRSSTGGGISNNYYGVDSIGYAPPSYQANLPSSFALTNGTTVSRTGRATPDVAFNAAINGGVLAYVGFESSWYVIGGTSAASPAWAAIMALVNQAHGSPVGFINPAIYNLAQSGDYISAFHDITVGNNTDDPGTTENGFIAGTGYDLTTGWGTVDVANFVKDIQFFVAASGASTYPVSLVQGWNLISVPLVPQNTPISTVLGALAAAGAFTNVWSYQGGTWKSATLNPTTHAITGPLTTMQDGLGYWIYMNQNDTLYVNGYVIPPAASPPSYSLPVGWNLIGFKPQPTVTSEQTGGTSGYLNSIEATPAGPKYDVTSVWIYDNVHGTWTRATDSTTINPGQALWIYMYSAGTLHP